MTGFRVATPDGILTLQARQRADASYAQEVDVAPARKTGVSPSERLSIGTGATVSLSPPGGATHALLSTENNDLRFYDTGDTPTTGASGNGHVLPAGQWLELDLATMAQFKGIAVSATVIAQVTYWRYGS